MPSENISRGTVWVKTKPKKPEGIWEIQVRRYDDKVDYFMTPQSIGGILCIQSVRDLRSTRMINPARIPQDIRLLAIEYVRTY